jgi:hypothetical protein
VIIEPMGTPRVAILLTTFHPSTTLSNQVESIAAQQGVDISIYWGDDGSTQQELDFVRSQLKFMNFREFHSSNIGPAENFFHLMSQVENADYVAYSDQDDIWVPNKLIRHIQKLSEYEELPSATHSNAELLISDLLIKKKSRCQRHDLATLLVENCSQGCTMVLNFRAVELLNSRGHVGAVMHDWWTALAVAATGHLIYIPGTDTHYRLHDNNAIGNPNILHRLTRALSRQEATLIVQAKNLHSEFGDQMRPLQLEMINDWLLRFDANWLRRIRWAFMDQKRRSSLLEDFFRRFLGIFKRP